MTILRRSRKLWTLEQTASFIKRSPYQSLKSSENGNQTFWGSPFGLCRKIGSTKQRISWLIMQVCATILRRLTSNGSSRRNHRWRQSTFFRVHLATFHRIYTRLSPQTRHDCRCSLRLALSDAILTTDLRRWYFSWIRVPDIHRLCSRPKPVILRPRSDPQRWSATLPPLR